MGKNYDGSKRGKDKKGKSWKQMNISVTLLLNSIVCDRYLCSKVVSTLGSDGICLNVKPIQVLRTVIIACLIYVSNSVDLVAVKVILVKLCAETKLQMFSKHTKGTSSQNFSWAGDQQENQTSQRSTEQRAWAMTT